MPVLPLRFDNFKNLLASIQRLRKAALVKAFKQDDTIVLKTHAALRDHLLVSLSGETYLLNDIKRAVNSGEQPTIYLVDTLGNELPAKDIHEFDTAYLLHNRPLAQLLEGLRLHSSKDEYTLTLPQNTLLFPFTPIQPVLTQNETTEEAYFAARCNLHAASRGQDVLFPVLLDNRALSDIIAHSQKSITQLEDDLLALKSITYHYQPDYNLARYTKLREKITHLQTLPSHQRQSFIVNLGSPYYNPMRTWLRQQGAYLQTSLFKGNSTLLFLLLSYLTPTGPASNLLSQYASVTGAAIVSGAWVTFLEMSFLHCYTSIKDLLMQEQQKRDYPLFKKASRMLANTDISAYDELLRLDKTLKERETVIQGQLLAAGTKRKLRDREPTASGFSLPNPLRFFTKKYQNDVKDTNKRAKKMKVH